MDCGLRTLRTLRTLLVPRYIQDVEIKHYTLSGTIFGHLSHPPNPYWTGWLHAHVSLTFDGKGGRWEGFFKMYFVSLSQLEDTFTRCKKYSSKLDIISLVYSYLWDKLEDTFTRCACKIRIRSRWKNRKNHFSSSSYYYICGTIHINKHNRPRDGC